MKKYWKFIFLIVLFLSFLFFFFYHSNTASIPRSSPRESIRTFSLLTSVDYSDQANPLVTLDWSNYGSSSNAIFKGYQSRDGGNTWESISLMDYTSVRLVRVLNIYPEKGDGLEAWMEEEMDSETGEVIGKGIIQVDKIGISDFNTSPSTYLKKTGADWNYDVLVFGFWDRNNYYDLTSASEAVVDAFIQDGRGVVFGHDTGVNNSLSRTDTHEITGDTAKEGQTNFTELMLRYLPMHWEDGLNVGNTVVEITKKGLLTQYPWSLGEIGTKYTIPYAHSWGQVLDDSSNIWMKFEANETVAGSNFYIVTSNNVAMVQTGHSSGQSMEAEQKILANLIFYCYQLTSATNVVDYSSMDVTSPSKPTITMDGGVRGISVDLSATDEGNSYQYYIEGYTKPDMSVVTSKSNISEAEVITGLKGYYYIIDDQAESDFSRSDATLILSNSLSIPFSNHGKYLHVRSVDYAGNVSDVSTSQILLDKYDLTLDLDGGVYDGVEVMKVIDLFYEESITLSVPTKENYVFDHWQKITESRSVLNGNVFQMIDECRLKATWKEDFNHNGIDDDLDPKYTIVYQDGLADSLFTKQIYTTLVGLSTPTFVGTPSRTNYVFSGWNPSVSTFVSSDATYTAIWREDLNNNGTADEDEEKYTITYQDGISGAAFSSQTYTNQLFGLSTPLFQGTPTRYRYLFRSWNPNVSSFITGNAVYTAVWTEDFNLNGIADDEEEKYTVIYQDGVDGEVFEPVSFLNLLSNTETPPFSGELIRQGYVFSGWSPTVSNLIEGNAVYTAVWAEDFNQDGVDDETQPKYVVKYTDGCDQDVFDDKIIDNVLVGMETPPFDGTPVRENYIFAGWTPDVEDQVSDDIIYVAQWREDFNHNGIDDELDPKYTVTFQDGKDGLIFREFTVTVLHGMSIPEVDTSKFEHSLYEFVGWDSSLEGAIYEDKVFTAQWNEILHEVPNTSSSFRILIGVAILFLVVGAFLFVYTFQMVSKE